jgi:hypothetical protein
MPECSCQNSRQKQKLCECLVQGSGATKLFSSEFGNYSYRRKVESLGQVQETKEKTYPVPVHENCCLAVVECHISGGELLVAKECTIFTTVKG